MGFFIWYLIGVLSMSALCYFCYKFKQSSVTLVDLFIILFAALFGPVATVLVVLYIIDEFISPIDFEKIKIIRHPEDKK